MKPSLIALAIISAVALAWKLASPPSTIPLPANASPSPVAQAAAQDQNAKPAPQAAAATKSPPPPPVATTNTAEKLSVDLRNAGTLSAANNLIIRNWCGAVAKLDDAIATEIGSTDTWAVQKQKILLLVAGFAIPKVVGVIDPGLAGDLASVGALIVSIQTQVQN